jgi:hypothetical protein
MRRFSFQQVSIAFFASMVLAAVAFVQCAGAEKPKPQAPIVTCHAGTGLECAFTFHKENQAEAIHLDLNSSQYQLMDDSLIGAPYCVAVGKGKVPQPRWPKCLSEANNVWTNGVFHKVGVVRPGNVND